MWELEGTIKDVSVDFRSNKAFLTLSIEHKKTAIDCYDDLHTAEKLTIKIDKYKKKRSLNANAYAWKLITEIANKLLADKDEIYLLMLKRYGQRELISVRADVPISEYIKYCEEVCEVEMYGELFKEYFVYKGSSEYNTEEMSIFIDGIVQEAKELHIQTETPEQIARMKDLWGV
jgi:hypothetical protein